MEYLLFRGRISAIKRVLCGLKHVEHEGPCLLFEEKVVICLAFTLLKNLLLRCIGIYRPIQMDRKLLMRLNGIDRLKKAGSFIFAFASGR